MSTTKRPPSPGLIANPFIKKRNLDWTLQPPDQDTADIQPEAVPSQPNKPAASQPTTADIESGSAAVTDHLALFATTLTKHTISSVPVLPVSSYASLYTSQAGSTRGAHFVIHQHDHPIAGTHYDLRLQINETSSVSWAIMYGLPGDPNSQRLNRNATETRIHCLWNHLIETASASTGSMLIWDTGTYTVLPRRSKHDPRPDPSSPIQSPSSSQSPSSPSSPSQQSLLHTAFQQRKIRLRLHGSRLPDPYVVYLRLTRDEDAAGRQRSARGPRTRRRTRRTRGSRKSPEETSDDDDEDEEEPNLAPESRDADSTAENPPSAMEREIRELEDEQVRETNAYPGASNTIGSVHQRRWYLSLDRTASGFAPRGKNRIWEPDPTNDGGERPSEDERPEGQQGCRLEYPFYVRGADHERSIVTGRRGEDILRDEGVTGFVQRKGWNPVLK